MLKNLRIIFSSTFCSGLISLVNDMFETVIQSSSSSLWVFMCTFSVLDLMNDFLHTWHLNGFSARCLRSWSTKWPWVVNLLPQSSKLQTYGFSPVWVRKCVLRFPFSAKLLLQSLNLQTKGLSPVWTRSWTMSLDFLL